MTRVLIIVQNLPVPFDRRVWLECQALLSDGHQVAVVCPKGDDDPSYQVIDTVELYKYRGYFSSGSKTGFVWEYVSSFLASAWLTFKARRSGRFGVIQACNPPDIFWPIALVLRALDRTRFVFDHHDLCPELYESRFPDGPRLPYKMLRALERRTHRTADHVISTNGSYRDVALTRSGKPASDVTVVRTGPDPQRLRRGPAYPELRRGRRFLAAYIGVMGPQDGVDIVVRAADVVVHQMGRDDIAFTLIGSGDCFDELVALRDELGLAGHVEFTGRAPDELVACILSTADVGLSPDPKNPLNDVSTMNKTMEYMAFELPVVAFDLRETRVSAADAGVYVVPNDVNEYAAAIVELMDDEPTRSRLGKPVEDRCRLAEKAGAAPEGAGMEAAQQALAEISDGRGADHVLLAAGGSSNGPVEAAVKLARDRARVVDIGKTRLDLPWNAYYDKELDVRFSRSYGPGRYDDRYELEGIDYPAGYVRWTERRNLECFLDLIARGEIEVQSLVSGVFPIDQATAVYHDLASGSPAAVGVLLEYPPPAAVPVGGQPPAVSRAIPVSKPAAPRGTGGKQLAMGFIGAGNYASSMLLPHLARMGTAQLAATTRSLSAVNAQRRFGFTTASTNADAVLGDESLGAIFIVTRHHAHAELVCRALEAGKAVFVEKPLALTRDEMQRIVDAVANTGNDRLMVGFNRRFAPLLVQMRSQFGPPDGGSSAGTWSTRGGWRPTAGTSTGNWKGRGSRGKAATSSTRSAGGRAVFLRLSTPSPAWKPTTCRPRSGSRTARAASSPTSRPAAPAIRRKRSTPRPAARAHGVHAELDGASAILRWPAAPVPGTARLELPGGLRWSLCRGETDPILGWYSYGLGRRTPAFTLVGCGRSAPDTSLITRLEFLDYDTSATHLRAAYHDNPFAAHMHKFASKRTSP